MGENAEDMVEGTTCSMCGMFFQDPNKPDHCYTHGFPVVCWDCWKDLSKGEGRSHVKALVKTLN